MVQGSRAIQHLIEDGLECEVAWDKTRLAATSQKLGESIRRLIPGGASLDCTGYKLLGADVKAARTGTTRGSRARPTLMNRKEKAAAKQKRNRIWRRMAGRRAAGKLFVAGVLPVGTYGTEVTGALTSELEVIQKQWIGTVASTSSGSRKATLLLKGDPAHQHSVAAMCRFHREVWRALPPVTRAATRSCNVEGCQKPNMAGP